MSVSDFVGFIKSVATEQEYGVAGEDSCFQVYIGKYNAVAFEVRENSSGYLQVHQWEMGEADDTGKYGRAVYSLRNYSDVVQFCNIMIASASVRARRN